MLITAVQCHPRYLPSANSFEVPMSLLSYVFPRSHCQHNLSDIVTVKYIFDVVPFKNKFATCGNIEDSLTLSSLNLPLSSPRIAIAILDL